MNYPLEVDPVSEDRMEIFVKSDSGAVLTGKRRTGRKRLLDDLREFLIERFPEKHIVPIKERSDIESVLKSPFPEDSIVLIYGISDFPDWENVVRNNTTGRVTVYYGQDLCHQVPACLKSVINDYI
jgi:hypothetical protein